MYDYTKWGRQIDEARRALFGNDCLNHADALRISEEAARRYVLPKDVRLEYCVEDTNGEWVPESSLRK